jgi:excisionase family DNA binding protein
MSQRTDHWPAPTERRILEAVTEPADSLLTAEKVAERWGVTKEFVYRLAREGKLPKGEVVVELGRYYRFRLEGLEAFEAAGGTAQSAA